MMHWWRKTTLKLLITLSVWLGGPAAQTHAQKVSYGIGLNSGLMHVATTLRTIAVRPINQPAYIDTLERPSSMAPFLGLSFTAHARLKKWGADRSLGLSANPLIGFYVPRASDDKGDRVAAMDTYGGPVLLQMPLMLQFTQDMFSFSESEKDRGWGVGVGLEATWMYDGWQRENKAYKPLDYNFILTPSFMLRPVGAIYWRHWVSGNLPVEWALHFATIRQQYALGSVARPMLRLSYTLYLNY